MNEFESISEYFDYWNELKKDLHFTKNRPYFKEREVWWASIGQNIGDEINGKNEHFERPVLIIKRLYNNMFFGLPLSTKIKRGSYYFAIKSQRVHGIVVLSQIKTLDAKRLIRKIETIDENIYVQILTRLKNLI